MKDRLQKLFDNTDKGENILHCLVLISNLRGHIFLDIELHASMQGHILGHFIL